MPLVVVLADELEEVLLPLMWIVAIRVWRLGFGVDFGSSRGLGGAFFCLRPQSVREEGF